MRSIKYILGWVTMMTCLHVVAQSPKSILDMIDARVQVTQVEPWWNPLVDQTALLAKERQEHPEPSEGYGGYYVKISYADTPPRKIDGETRIAIYREKDPLHPIYPINDNMSRLIDWSKLEPIILRVTPEGRIFHGFDEQGKKKYTESIFITRRHPTWKPIEFFLPHDFFSFSQIKNFDYKEALQVKLYIRVCVGDEEKNTIGTNTAIPSIYYYWEPPRVPHIEDLGSEDLSALFDEPQTEQERDSTSKVPFSSNLTENEDDSGNGRKDDNGNGRKNDSGDGSTPRRPPSGNPERIVPPTTGKKTTPPEPPTPPTEVCSPHEWVNIQVWLSDIKESYIITDGGKLPKKQQVIFGSDTLQFKKIKSEWGDNIYLSNAFTKDSIQTKDDAEVFVAQLNEWSDSLHLKQTFRLPIQTEVGKPHAPKDDSDDGIYNDFFQADSVLLVLEDKRELAPPQKKVKACYVTKHTFRRCRKCSKENKWSARLIFADRDHVLKYKRKNNL